MLVLALVLTSAAAASVGLDSVWLVQTRSLLDSLEDLFSGGTRSDLVLRVQTPDRDQVVVLPVHSLILTIHSPVLSHMIATRKSDTLELTESADTTRVFSRFIRYLYRGELQLDPDETVAFHKLASKFNVTSLQRGLVRHMTLSLRSDWSAGLVTSWYEYSVQMNEVSLREACLLHLSLHLSALLSASDWVHLSPHLLLSLLPRSDLVLDSELDLFHGVESWILHNDPDGLTAENALRAVRYAMIPPTDLFQIQTESVVLARYRESVRDLLFQSFQFQAASPVTMGGFLEVDCSLFVPRLYLGPDWGSEWLIRNPARDDRSTTVQTRLGPAGSDRNKRVSWNLLFNPRWLPAGSRPGLSETSPGTRALVRPRISVSPVSSGPDLVGILFQKSVLVLDQNRVQRVCSFLHNSEDCLTHDDLERDQVRVHLIIRPLYQRLDRD